jgi:hypothetical protein
VIGDILEVVIVGLVAGVGITAAYSFVVLGVSRAAEARRSGEAGTAVAFGAVAGVAMLVFAAAVVFGVRIMLTKS